MKKLVTRPKNYEGCDPDIAECLQKGLEVKCVSSRGDEKWVIGYSGDFSSPYLIDDSLWCVKAASVQPVLLPVLKPFPELLKMLIEDGYKPDPSGHWVNGNTQPFTASMMQAAADGKMVEGFKYRPEWLDNT